MTLAQKIEAAGAFAKASAWWLILVGLVVGALLLSRACNRADTAEAALRRANETANLKDAGFLVASQATRKALDAQAAELTTISGFQAEIARLKKASPGVRVVYVDRAVTTPAPAEGVPRPPEAPGAPCPQCLFAWGDTGQLRIDSVGLETREGVQVAVVGGEAWRVEPGPETRILAGVASAPLSTASAEPVPLTTKPGWGAGALAGVGTQGATGEVVIMTPPFLGSHLSAAGAGQLGAGPSGAVMLGLVWR
jgi:hypothetical protein